MYKLKKYGFLTLIGVGFGLLAFLLPKAIKFFFRGFQILLEHPLEGFSFFLFLTIFISIGIYTEEKETKKSLKKSKKMLGYMEFFSYIYYVI